MNKVEAKVEKAAEKAEADVKKVTEKTEAIVKMEKWDVTNHFI